MESWHDRMFEDGIIFFLTEIIFNIFTNPFFAYPILFILVFISFILTLVILLNLRLLWYYIQDYGLFLKSLFYHYINENIMFVKYNIVELKYNFKNYGWRQWLIIGVFIFIGAIILTLALTSGIQIFFPIEEN